jgi:hypothetical protein
MALLLNKNEMGEGRWITTDTGQHIFIKEGQTAEEAVKERFSKIKSTERRGEEQIKIASTEFSKLKNLKIVSKVFKGMMAQMFAESKGNRIYINKDKWDNISLEKQEYIIYHEIGHALLNSYKANKIKYIKNYWSSGISKDPKIKIDLSDLAATWPTEAFAESYAQYKTGKLSAIGKRFLDMSGFLKQKTTNNSLTSNAKPKGKIKNRRSLDPSRTTILRRAFISDVHRRFMKIARAVKVLIDEEDCFGLKDAKPFTFNAQPQQFRFLTDADKVTAFRKWFSTQINAGVLSVKALDPKKPWLADYVESAYKKGTLRAYIDVNRVNVSKPLGFYEGARREFLRSSFAQPEAVSKVQLIYTRAYNDLKGVTDVMA